MGKKQGDVKDAVSTGWHRDQRVLGLRHLQCSLAVFANKSVSVERVQSSPEIGLEIATEDGQKTWMVHI